MIEPTIPSMTAALTSTGFIGASEALAADRRNERVAVRLSDDRIAWFSENESGRSTLERDARILGLIEKYCCFCAPRVLHQDAQAPLSGASWLNNTVFPQTNLPIGFLGFRFGHMPTESWCGRTLVEDLTWTDRALTACGF